MTKIDSLPTLLTHFDPNLTLFDLKIILIFQTSIFNKPDDVFDDDESDVDHPQPAYRQYETTVRSLFNHVILGHMTFDLT